MVWIAVVVGAALGIAIFWLWPPGATPPRTLISSGPDSAIQSNTLASDQADVSRRSPGDEISADGLGDGAGAIAAENELLNTISVKPESRSVIRVQVLNGCGRKGLAKWVAPALRAKGFDVRETSNASRFDHAQTLVYDRNGVLQNGLRLADSLGIEPARVSTAISHQLVDIDVTLIIGADYESLSLDVPETE